METAFTPLQSLLGGTLIGVASVLLMLTLGRVMGATGIVAGILAPSSRADWLWRVALVGGMIAAPLAIVLATGQMPEVQVPVSRAVLIAGGLLVGIGVTFGAGCTSGHGVCGMARLSPRSIAATLTFMATTAATVYVIRHVLGA
ncbi:MAG: YeeE/YedE family protein [Rhodobacter sp.]|nr:YeeE/YedE family protein [Rhodobacter sp.]MBK8439080.1 YeeE/YedE family protein [Rhodobacter sp.]